jgi:hypothetical protein
MVTSEVKKGKDTEDQILTAHFLTCKRGMPKIISFLFLQQQLHPI